ncbi:MAG: serine hydrolase [Saprospiraceae bacterium]|nr:serine hydrolase [Saprospiraceae bacterium]
MKYNPKYLLLCYAPFLLSFQYTEAQKINGDLLDSLLLEYDIPSISIAYFENNQVSYIGTHGYKSMDTKEPVEKSTIYSAASLSKPAFAYAVLLLAQDGKIDLDKPLHKYLVNENLKEDARYRKITARMILSHSSGLPNWRNGKLQLLFEPGSDFQYSGEGYMYLAKVIESILQQDINDVMKEWVFQPLEMGNSSFVWENHFKSFAIPHDYTNTAKPLFTRSKPIIASSLQTTPSDFAKLMIAINTKNALSPDYFNVLVNPQSKISESLGWGLGWAIQDGPKNKYLWQWGDNGNFKGFSMMYPDENKGMVFFVNSPKGLRILPKLVKYLFDDKIPEFDMLAKSMSISPDEKLLLSILNNGYKAGVQEFLISNNSKIDTSKISLEQLGFVAMQLKWRNKFLEEKGVLKVISNTFSSSFKAQKNYAAHCVKHGFTKEGILYYKKALEIKPQDKSISRTIHLLTSNKLEGNVTFGFSDYLWASSVSVSGSFNNWSYSSIPMLKRNGIWQTTIELDPGAYSYQFIVNGYPILDPKNSEIIEENNQIMSLLKVKNE